MSWVIVPQTIAKETKMAPACPVELHVGCLTQASTRALYDLPAARRPE